MKKLTRLKKSLQLVGLVLAVAAACHSSHAQQGDDILRIESDLVILNVTVIDRSGQYVRGLRKSDFKIYEDGVEVPLGSITAFSLQETPFASVILLDTSGSMEARLSLARSAAIRFLDGLREEDVAAVYKFDTKVELVQDFSSGRDLAPMAYGIKADGMTVLNDAIVKAAALLSERPEQRKAIVVLSDGLDTFSKASSTKALDTALALGAGIYTVDMSSSDGAASRNNQSALVLKNFAEKSGARFVATPGGPALREAFASIADELGHQYTLGYRPVNKAHDGKWRNLEVKVTAEKTKENLTVRTRKGYRAPKA